MFVIKALVSVQEPIWMPFVSIWLIITLPTAVEALRFERVASWLALTGLLIPIAANSDVKFLATDFEQEVFQELMKIKQMDYLSGVPFPLYFWYDRETEMVDLKTLERY